MSKEYVEDAVLKHQRHERQAEEYPIRAYEIRDTDRLMVEGRQQIIDSVNVGNKYVHVALANGANRKFLMADPVVVVRFEKTEAARKAEELLDLREYVRKTVERHEKDAKKHLDELVKKLGHDLNESWRVTDTYGAFTRVMEAKADHEPMQLLVDLYRGTHVDTYKGDEVEALLAARQWAKDAIMRSHRFVRGLSRSTSVVSNILDDARVGALASFLEATSWYLDDDMRCQSFAG